jgi:hypothetical protein
MPHNAPLKYIFYIAASPEQVWEGFEPHHLLRR